MCRFWCRCVCLGKKREKKGGIVVIRGKEEKSMISNILSSDAPIVDKFV